MCLATKRDRFCRLEDSGDQHLYWTISCLLLFAPKGWNHLGPNHHDSMIVIYYENCA